MLGHAVVVVVGLGDRRAAVAHRRELLARRLRVFSGSSPGLWLAPASSCRWAPPRLARRLGLLEHGSGSGPGSARPSSAGASRGWRARPAPGPRARAARRARPARRRVAGRWPGALRRAHRCGRGAASRVAWTTPAIDAPVSSRTPASSRKTNRMWEPATENSLEEVQNSDSPTRPPWWRRYSGSRKPSRGVSPGPRPNEPAASPSVSAAARQTPPVLSG